MKLLTLKAEIGNRVKIQLDNGVYKLVKVIDKKESRVKVSIPLSNGVSLHEWIKIR